MKKIFMALCMVAFAIVGCGDDESWSPSARANDDSSEETSSSSEKAKSSSSASVKNSSSSVSRSSSSSPDSWDWRVPKEARLNPEIEYDSITDSRDGQVYKTVKIGDQVWMAQNLNYDKSVRGLIGHSWCYRFPDEHVDTRCDVTGRLYNWSAAIDSVGLLNREKSIICGNTTTCTLPDTVYGICPSGWHLPSMDEWNALFDAVGGGGKFLKSRTGWNDDGNGTDDFGFSALPAGYKDRVGNFKSAGNETMFWCANDYDIYEARIISISDKKTKRTTLYKYFAASVRCVKNSSVVPVSSSSDTPLSSSSATSVSSSSKDPEPKLSETSSCSADEMESSSSETVVSSSSSDGSELVEGSSSSSEILAAPCKSETEDNCEYGTLLDDRDDQTYKTVKIDDQWWMAENLNYADSAKTPSLKGKSWCYGDEPDNCAKYGRLYTWAAAIDSVALATDGENPQDCGYMKSSKNILPDVVHGICPDGWHLPDYRDFSNMLVHVGGYSIAGTVLKSQSGWNEGGNGTDTFGFNVLPAGIRIEDGSFDGLGDGTDFWSATESDLEQAFSLYASYENEYSGVMDYAKNYAFSIRCVKD